jgi:hypothetical protein
MITNEQLQEIADNLDFGLRCFIHKDNADIKCFPDEDQFGSFDDEAWQQDIQAVKKGRKKYLEIEKMPPREEYGVMEAFARQVAEGLLQEKLLWILNRPKPFRHFKAELDQAGPYREKWFAFKAARMLDWVKGQVLYTPTCSTSKRSQTGRLNVSGGRWP